MPSPPRRTRASLEARAAPARLRPPASPGRQCHRAPRPGRAVRATLAAVARFASGQIGALVLGALCMKVVAVVSGPAGVGLYSLLRQIQITLSAVGSLGGQNVIVQGVASRSGAARDAYVAWTMLLVAGASLLVALALVSAAPVIADALLPGIPLAATVLRWTTAAVVVGAFMVAMRSVLNGAMAIGAVTWVNLGAALAALLLAYPAARAHSLGSPLAMAGLLIGSLTAGLLVALVAARRRGDLRRVRWPQLRARIDIPREFLRLALPSLLTMLTGLGVVLAVRSHIVGAYGLPAAGFFDAAWSVSLTLVVAFLASIQAYLLPALSRQTAAAQANAILVRTIRLAVMIGVVLLAGLIVFKPWLIRALYSAEFMPALELLRWLLLGDFLRIVGWVLATSLLARADIRVYTAAELLWNASFALLVAVFVDAGIEAIGPAYVAAYALYLLLLAWRSIAAHGLRLPRAVLIQWLVGGAVVAAVSALTWNAPALEPMHLVPLPVALLAAWLGLSPSERQAARRTLAAAMGRVRRR